METKAIDTEFNRLFGEYQKPVYNYVLRMVKDRPSAEELTQDVFVRIYRSLSDFRGESELSTWVFKIATNVSLDHFRSKSHKNAERDSTFDEEALSSESPRENVQEFLSVEDELINAEMAGCVKGYIDDLPGDYRAVLLLHDHQGFKNREIAKITGASLENVKIRLHRARNKMRGVFSSKCNIYRDGRDVLRCVEKEGDECGGRK
ncbi:MAG: RNA polymerase sigma factor [candidate division Zixibacteria bacterium]